MLRRAAGLAAWVLLLNLGYVASSKTCPAHEASPSSQQSEHGQHEEHGGHGQPEAPPAEQQSCDMSMACTLPFEINGGSATVGVSAALGRVTGFSVTAPASTVRAPDPPPPKA